jgi:hypothetical protein
MRERELEEKGSKRHAPSVNYDYRPQGYRRKELPQGLSFVIYINPDLHLGNSFENKPQNMNTEVFREP